MKAVPDTHQKLLVKLHTDRQNDIHAFVSSGITGVRKKIPKKKQVTGKTRLVKSKCSLQQQW